MADYTKTEPAFDFQKGDFIIINDGRQGTYKKLGAKNTQYAKGQI